MRKKIIGSLFALVLLTCGLMAQGDAYWRIGPSYTPAAPRPGETVTITGTVSLNHGTMTSVLVRGGVDGTRLYNYRIPILEVGDMVELSFTWTATEGLHTLWFAIDPTHEQTDANRDGDRWEQVIRPRHLAYPDLQFGMSSFSVTPSTFEAGETVTFHYGISNIGGSNATETFDVGLRVDGTIVQRHTYTGMEAGRGAVNDFIWTAVCGVNVEIVADCDGVVTEVNETNNVMDDDRLECGASWHESKNFWFENIRPDTSSTPLTHRTTPTRITADLHYEGTTGSGTHQTEVHMGTVSGGVVRTQMLTGLTLPGDAVTPVSFDVALPVGTTRVFFEVDRARRIAEFNESDNRLEQDIRVTGGSKSGLPSVSPPTKKLDYRVGIKNKNQLKLKSFKAGVEIRIPGVLVTSGLSKPGMAKVQVTFGRVKVPGLPIKKVMDVRVPKDGSVPLVFRQVIKTAGQWQIHVEVLVKDTNPANNKDSAVFTVK